MEPPVAAVYDANVLYPAPLRDLLIRLAQTGLVRTRWTETIHDEWLHPDDFLVGLLEVAPGPVCGAVKRQRESLRNPPKSAEELLTTLEGLGQTQAVARLRQFMDLL